MNHRVVITGIGVVSPVYIGSDPATFVSDHWKQSNNDYFSKIENITDSLEKHVPYNVLRRMCRFSQLALYSNIFCWKDAGISIKEENERIGSIMNTCYGPLDVTENLLKTLIQSGPQAVSPSDFSNTVNNCATGQVSLYLGLKGVSTTLISSSAITYGYDLIKQGKAEAIFVSGVDEANDNVCHVMKDKGFQIMEHSCCVLLEDYEHALKRNAKIYSEILDCNTYYCTDEAFLQHTLMKEQNNKISFSNHVFNQEQISNKITQLDLFDCNKVFHHVLGATEIINVICAATFINEKKWIRNTNSEIAQLDLREEEKVLSASLQHGNCLSLVSQGGI